MIRKLRQSATGGECGLADYIDREILSQAYVHIEIDLDEYQIADLKKHLELFVSSRGRFFLYENVATEVELKEGSLKLYLSVLGVLYVAIGQYGSFREGVNYLAEDAKRLADCVVSESLFLTKSRHDNTIRTEARIGVVGSLKNAVDRLAFIRDQMGHVTIKTSMTQISDLQDQIDRLLANLNDPSDPPYVASELCKLAREILPQIPVHDPKKPRPSQTQISMYQRMRSELIEHLAKISKRST